jgi:hypothetical protein
VESQLHGLFNGVFLDFQLTDAAEKISFWPQCSIRPVTIRAFRGTQCRGHGMLQFDGNRHCDPRWMPIKPRFGVFNIKDDTKGTMCLKFKLNFNFNFNLTIFNFNFNLECLGREVSAGFQLPT